MVTAQEDESGFNVVEKFVHHNSKMLGPKMEGNVFFMKHAWEKCKIDLRLKKKSTHSNILTLLMEICNL